MIKKLNADSLPTNILVGSLLETVEAFQQKKDSIKSWQTKGKDFYIACDSILYLLVPGFIF